MKRSEMISIIQPVLCSLRKSEEFTDNELAKYILEVVEINGMIPPMFKDDSVDINDLHDIDFKYRNEWEPEDEA